MNASAQFLATDQAELPNHANLEEVRGREEGGADLRTLKRGKDRRGSREERFGFGTGVVRSER